MNWLKLLKLLKQPRKLLGEFYLFILSCRKKMLIHLKWIIFDKILYWLIYYPILGVLYAFYGTKRLLQRILSYTKKILIRIKWIIINKIFFWVKYYIILGALYAFFGTKWLLQRIMWLIIDGFWCVYFFLIYRPIMWVYFKILWPIAIWVYVFCRFLWRKRFVIRYYLLNFLMFFLAMLQIAMFYAPEFDASI